MRKLVGVAGVFFLACGLWSAQALADDGLWSITTPYPGNPLKVAVLEGKGQVGKVPFPVMLELSCHPDAAVPRAVLRLPVAAGGWNMKLFDGASGGAGQRLRTLAVYGSNRRLLDRPRFNGAAGEDDSFMLSWQPNDALLATIGRSGDGVLLRLAGVHRTLGQLEARFVFPQDASAMIDALQPCSKAIKVQGKAANGQ